MADKTTPKPRTPIEPAPPSRLRFGDLLLGLAGVDKAVPEPSPDIGPTAVNSREHPTALHRLVLRAVDNPDPGTGRRTREAYDAGMSHSPGSYTLPVIVEPAKGAWHAYCPTLLDYGAAIWAATREAALEHIGEVVAMVVGRLAQDGAPIPSVPADHEQVTPEPGLGERIVIMVEVPRLEAPA